MKTTIRTALFAMGSMLMVASAGCGGNPVAGRWTNSSSNMGSSFTITLDLKADGAADFSLGNFNINMNACTGSLNYTGARWAVSGMNIEYTGTPVCSGMITCMIAGMTIPIDCMTASGMGMMNTVGTGTNMFSLSSDNNTLTLTSSSGPTVFTRAPSM